ncbi:MAG: serine hydrolase domain-containing protein [Bacteroidia bacterium]
MFAQHVFIDKLRSDSNVTGLQLVWTKGNMGFNYNSGYAFTNVSEKVKSTTIFQAASLSKVVLAYICMQLVAEKKLNLDTPLYSYYRYPRIESDPKSKIVTGRMVLTHTTGWPNWVQNPMQKTWGSSSLKTQFQPGTKWGYSGEGFVFLQLVIQNIIRQDFQSIAKERVFIPLGMKNSSFIWEDRFAATATYGFNSKNEPTERSEYFLPNAAFSLLTTASDYAVFLKALMTHHLPSILSKEISLSNPEQLDANKKYLYWGVGLGIQKNELGKLVWHWGDNGDYKTFFIIHPEKQEILVCFTNSINGLKLMKPLANHFFGAASWYAADWLQ